jgi:hypothetical protein
MTTDTTRREMASIETARISAAARLTLELSGPPKAVRLSDQLCGRWINERTDE